jgi:hypothetical protein
MRQPDRRFDIRKSGMVRKMTNSEARVFDHVLVIIFENEYRSYVMKNPYMSGLAAQGIELVNHFGVMHPSQTNYVSAIAGELCNITYDWPPYPPVLPHRTIVDLIEESPLGLRWKAYLQGNVKTLWKPGDPVGPPFTSILPPADSAALRMTYGTEGMRWCGAHPGAAKEIKLAGGDISPLKSSGGRADSPEN